MECLYSHSARSPSCGPEPLCARCCANTAPATMSFQVRAFSQLSHFPLVKSRLDHRAWLGKRPFFLSIQVCGFFAFVSSLARCQCGRRAALPACCACSVFLACPLGVYVAVLLFISASLFLLLSFRLHWMKSPTTEMAIRYFCTDS